MFGRVWKSFGAYEGVLLTFKEFKALECLGQFGGVLGSLGRFWRASWSLGELGRGLERMGEL